VYRWLAGEHATVERVADLNRFASDVADFLAALHEIDPGDGPGPGKHNFFRGGPLATYDSEARAAISALSDEVDAAAATQVWEAALAATRQGPSVWIHGDVTASNLLVVDGRPTAVIDFGSSGVGDPACDATIAWTFFFGDSREVFMDRLGLDHGTRARGRGWALWKAMTTLAGSAEPNDPRAHSAAVRMGWRLSASGIVDEVLANRG
jgi:aminoglycoside phosphotransferase (APT) family kinase protein